jgi:hypothetical protein
VQAPWRIFFSFLIPKIAFRLLFVGDNPLPAGESFDDYFSPSASDSFDDLDNISMLNMLAETFYSRQKEGP